MPTRFGQDKYLELTVWADCSGIDSEMFALRELGKALLELLNARVKWILYMACEMCKMSCAFATLNHNPMHMNGHMQHRKLPERPGALHDT